MGVAKGVAPCCDKSLWIENIYGTAKKLILNTLEIIKYILLLETWICYQCMKNKLLMLEIRLNYLVDKLKQIYQNFQTI